jgi:hypothetical protein
MSLEKDGAVTPKSLEGLSEIFARFEHSAVRAKWTLESRGIFTLEKDAEDVKSVSRELRKALVDTQQVRLPLRRSASYSTET